MTIPHWDLPLDDRGFKKLSPADKGRRIRAALERKVIATEHEADPRDPSARRTDIPTDRAKLRRWEGVEGERLYTWRDPSCDDPDGHNADLMRRLRIALDRIEATRRRGRAALREELRLERERSALLDRQVADLLGQVRQLRVELARARKKP